jgi:hypothetical protein
MPWLYFLIFPFLNRIIAMKLFPILVISAIVAMPTYAQEKRQLDAHEHGVGQLDIAFDGNQIAIELHAPGADIVGFEYSAENADDRAEINTAIATLTRPLNLFVLPDAAGCSVVNASAGLESEEDHGAHDDEHAGEDDGHDDEHAVENDGHDDDAEEVHENVAGHTEFHAEYLLTCADPAAITNITFAYFDAFPNALKVKVQTISDTGAATFEVERSMSTLDLRGMY